MNRFHAFAHKVSKNHTCTCWVLKCDIRKLFVSIDQTILLKIISLYIPDQKIVSLISEIVRSFSRDVILAHAAASSAMTSPTGLPLGNLTSQLLVNVYMNEFDQYAKHALKAKYYVRYADDFVIWSQNKERLEEIRCHVDIFLRERLKLELHPHKVSITTFASGVDFLGWVHFGDHRVLRTSTKRRMLKHTVGLDHSNPTMQSYLGMLRHGNAAKLRERISR